jgi:hypothetical protein
MLYDKTVKLPAQHKTQTNVRTDCSQKARFIIKSIFVDDIMQKRATAVIPLSHNLPYA